LKKMIISKYTFFPGEKNAEILKIKDLVK